MTTTTELGRERHRLLFNFLDRYPMATTHQLAALIWGGDNRLARAHLLRFTREGRLRRVPHPLHRNGCYVYMARGERSTSHSPKVLHHLQAVDFHVVVSRQLGKYGARITPELPWATGVTPDQTVVWRDTVWAIEHHLTGEFRHAGDYQGVMEEEAFAFCPWWRPGMRIGLLVITCPSALDQVRTRLAGIDLSAMTWRVATREGVLRDPGGWLRIDAGRLALKTPPSLQTPDSEPAHISTDPGPRTIRGSSRWSDTRTLLGGRAGAPSGLLRADALRPRKVPGANTVPHV